MSTDFLCVRRYILFRMECMLCRLTRQSCTPGSHTLWKRIIVVAKKLACPFSDSRFPLFTTTRKGRGEILDGLQALCYFGKGNFVSADTGCQLTTWGIAAKERGRA